MASDRGGLTQLMVLLALQVEKQRMAALQATNLAAQQVYALAQQQAAAAAATTATTATSYSTATQAASAYYTAAAFYSTPAVGTWAQQTSQLIDPVLQSVTSNTDAYLSHLISQVWEYGDPGGYLERSGEHATHVIERYFIREAENVAGDIATFVDDAGHLVDEAGRHMVSEAGHLIDEAGREVVDEFHHEIGEDSGVDVERVRPARKHFRPVGTVPTGDALRTGDITHAGAYARAADAYRYQQSLLDTAGKAIATDPHPAPPKLQSPLDAAVQRAQTVAATDVQLAMRNQSQKTLSAAAKQGVIIGYRRVLHPELDKGGVCGLCIAASTRIYKAEHLLAMHTGCECTVLPVTRDFDPGGIINDRDLGSLYTAAGGDTREQLEHTHFEVRHHSELGPVLVAKGAHYRTPAMVRRATSRSTRANSDAQRRRQLTLTRDSLARSLQRIDNELLPADPDRWHDYRQTLVDRVNSLNAQLQGGAR